MSNEVVTEVVSVAATVAVSTLTEKKAALIAKLTAEIASISSVTVKLRDTVYISLINAAGDALLEKLIAKIG